MTWPLKLFRADGPQLYAPVGAPLISVLYGTKAKLIHASCVGKK